MFEPQKKIVGMRWSANLQIDRGEDRNQPKPTVKQSVDFVSRPQTASGAISFGGKNGNDRSS
jgi:hypothetical protein